MPLSQKEKEAYIEVIRAIWPVYSQYTADDVTEEVAEIVDTVLEEIAKCSRGMAAVEEAYKAFYAPLNVNKWRQLLVKGAKAVIGWKQKASANVRYALCINGAAANYRSVLGIALVGV